MRHHSEAGREIRPDIEKRLKQKKPGKPTDSGFSGHKRKIASRNGKLFFYQSLFLDLVRMFITTVSETRMKSRFFGGRQIYFSN